MSKILYLVTEAGGRYDDERWENNLIVTTDQQTAEQFVEYAKLANEIRQQLTERAIAILAYCRIKVPEPHFAAQQETVPKWGKSMRQQDITPEMRSERDRILNKNKANADAYVKHQRENAESVRAMAISEMLKLGYSSGVAEFFVEQSYYFTSDQASYFDINEIQLI